MNLQSWLAARGTSPTLAAIALEAERLYENDDGQGPDLPGFAEAAARRSGVAPANRELAAKTVAALLSAYQAEREAARKVEAPAPKESDNDAINAAAEAGGWSPTQLAWALAAVANGEWSVTGAIQRITYSIKELRRQAEETAAYQRSRDALEAACPDIKAARIRRETMDAEAPTFEAEVMKLHGAEKVTVNGLPIIRVRGYTVAQAKEVIDPGGYRDADGDWVAMPEWNKYSIGPMRATVTLAEARDFAKS